MRVLILVVVILASISCGRSIEEGQKAAVASAHEFMQNYPNSTGHEACAKVDSDGDGYCSCTGFVKDGPPVAIECGCEKWCIFNCTDGCKLRLEYQVVKGAKQ